MLRTYVTCLMNSMPMKTLNKSNLLSVYLYKTAGWVTNRVDPDQTPPYAASDLVYIICSGQFVRIPRVNTCTLHLPKKTSM